LDVLYTKEGWVEAVGVYLLLVLFMFFDKLTVKPICPVRMLFLTGVSSESAALAMDTPYRRKLKFVSANAGALFFRHFRCVCQSVEPLTLIRRFLPEPARAKVDRRYN